MYQNRWYSAGGFIRDPIGDFTTLPCKDTWNLVLVHLRKIPRSAGRKFRFSLQLYSKMHGFKCEFSKFCWEGLTGPPPQTPLSAQSQASPSILRRFASLIRAAPSIHPSNMVNNPSPNRGVLGQTLFSPNPNFLATPLDQIFRSNFQDYVVGLIEIHQWKYPWRQAGRLFWKSSVMIRTRHTGTYTRNYTEHCSVWSYQTYRNDNNYGTDEAHRWSTDEDLIFLNLDF